MDWDLKMPPWDLADLDQNSEAQSIGSMVAGSSSGLGRRLDCSVDLKLGGLGDFGPSEQWQEQARDLSMVFPSSSSKRARAPGNAGHNAACLVDGCKADLSHGREYHRRHKVCEVHSKTPIVMIGGQQQRFCQQCSRFHMLVEFDEVKRSCRKRLDGHNRRRRKPQPESMTSGGMFPNHQGSRFLSYPPSYTSCTPEASWSGIVKIEDDTLYNHQPSARYMDKHQQFHTYKEQKQFPFLQDGSVSVCQSPRKTIIPMESSSNRVFPNEFSQVLDSDCALSLLSSPIQSSGINVGQLVPPARITMDHPQAPGLQYSGFTRYSRLQASNNVPTTGFSCSGIEEGNVAMSSDRSDSAMQCQGLFRIAGEGSSNAASPSLPFSWQ